jgi:MoxR-like ATPase
LLDIQKLVYEVYADKDIIEYVSDIVEISRNLPQIRLGISPRGGIMLLLASKAKALLEGRNYVLPDDVKVIAPHVLNHRVYLNPDAIFEGVTPMDMVKKILESVEVPT